MKTKTQEKIEKIIQDLNYENTQPRMKKTLINGKKLLTLLTISHIINFIYYLMYYQPTTFDFYELYSIFTFIASAIVVIFAISSYVCDHWNDKDLIDDFKKRNK